MKLLTAKDVKDIHVKAHAYSKTREKFGDAEMAKGYTVAVVGYTEEAVIDRVRAKAVELRGRFGRSDDPDDLVGELLEFLEAKG